jgi:uncharacterized protein
VSARENVDTVRTIYAAFGRGDVAAILDSLTDDVDWSSEGTSDSAPWFGQRIGKKAVASYFTSIAETIEVLDFTQLGLAANDKEVMVLNRFHMRSRKTGNEAAMQLHHYWRFRGRKVEYWRGSEDTELTVTMLKG